MRKLTAMNLRDPFRHPLQPTNMRRRRLEEEEEEEEEEEAAQGTDTPPPKRFQKFLFLSVIFLVYCIVRQIPTPSLLPKQTEFCISQCLSVCNIFGAEQRSAAQQYHLSSISIHT